MLGGHAGGCLAGRLRDRAVAPAAIPAIPGCSGQPARRRRDKPRARRVPGNRRLGRRVAERQGRRMDDALARLKAAGDRGRDAPIRCEGRGGGGRDRATRARCRCGSMPGNRAGRSTPIAIATRASSAARMLDRLAEAEAMTPRRLSPATSPQRDRSRALYAELGGGVRRLRQPRRAQRLRPSGLQSTGDPSCTVHASLLGIPAVSLPVLQRRRAAARPAG